MNHEQNKQQEAVEKAVDILSEYFGNGIIIMTDEDPNGATMKWSKVWGNKFAVYGAAQREMREQMAYEQFELDEMGGFCTHEEED